MNAIKKLFNEVTGHWSKPAEGQSLSYKEIALHSVGGNGINLINGMFATYANTAVSCLLTATVYGILPMDIWLIGVIVAFVGLLRVPIAGWIIDNTNTKFGKFRPLLLAFSIPTAILLVLMTIIPAQFMGVDGYRSRFISITLLSAALAFFQPTMTSVLGGLSQVMTMNTGERNKFYSIINITQNLFTSLMQIILPPIAVLIAPELGMESVKVYQITFPVIGVLGIAATLASVFGTKERMIVAKEKVARVKMAVGIKRCLTNKYFIFLTASFILGSLRASANVMNWICIYQMQQPLGTKVLGVATAICGFGHVPGMILGPLLAHKLGKKKALIIFHALGFLTILPMLLFLSQPFVLLVMIFIQNIVSGSFVVMETMKADILDYEQFKSGERLEGFFNNFQAAIIAIFGIGTTLVVPLILQTYCGIDTNMVGDELTNAYNILRNTEVRNKVFTSLILVASASYLLGMIPIFFYNLTDKRHKEIIESLKLRAAESTEAAEAEL